MVGKLLGIPELPLPRSHQEAQNPPANILEELTGVLVAESVAEVPILAGSLAMGSWWGGEMGVTRWGF